MARERLLTEWDRTSAILAMTASIHRDRKKRSRPYMPDEMNPYADRPSSPMLDGVDSMRELGRLLGVKVPRDGARNAKET